MEIMLLLPNHFSEWNNTLLELGVNIKFKGKGPYWGRPPVHLTQYPVFYKGRKQIVYVHPDGSIPCLSPPVACRIHRPMKILTGELQPFYVDCPPKEA